MADDWIVDVLDDLRAFAAGNGLPLLAEQLDDARLIALVEIGSQAPASTCTRVLEARGRAIEGPDGGCGSRDGGAPEPSASRDRRG